MPLQHIVKADNLRPVRFTCARSLRMHRCNRRLHRVGTERPAAQRQLHQFTAFADLRTVPQAAILLLEQHQIALGIATRVLA
ncbi:hypothetical protein D3C73_1531580 [compost metagenome]